jgi:hypothetical protein
MMNSQEFCYWVQGLFELSDPQELNEKQVAVIKEHLDLVLNEDSKLRPQVNNDFTTGIITDSLCFMSC